LRRGLYFACAALLGATSVVTYSRAGFLTMTIGGAFFLLKLSRRYPAAWALAGMAVVGLLATSPGRIVSMFSGSGGTGSAGDGALGACKAEHRGGGSQPHPVAVRRRNE